MQQIHIPSLAERRAEGKRLRDHVARGSHATWEPDSRRDILGIIRASNAGRVPKLVPMKMGLMAVSPFAFFRGAAPIMARDLSRTPVSGLTVQICGDAHVKNLGAYAGPEGALVFDINDFDETIHGPWEWDVKRLAASIVLAGREAGEKDCAAAVGIFMQAYREALHLFSGLSGLELAMFEIRGRSQNRTIRAVLEKAERVTPAKNLEKLTEPVKDGLPRFHDKMPALRHVPDETRATVIAALKPYRETVSAGRQLILDAYQPVDVAFKIVGTGSVGTRDFVILFLGNGVHDPMFLQIKEEMPSCYAPYLKRTRKFDNQGRRVAEGQQRMQTVNDPLLGWTTINQRPYLVRQLADHKAAIDPEELKGETLHEYATVCGTALAKGHARTGDGALLDGYCGNAAKLDKALAKFAIAYADQTDSDHALFTKAIKKGTITATHPLDEMALR
jgi:uncharacterized protein (DUF2252 family)